MPVVDLVCTLFITTVDTILQLSRALASCLTFFHCFIVPWLSLALPTLPPPRCRVLPVKEVLEPLVLG